MTMRLSVGANHRLELDPIHPFIPTTVEVQPGEKYRLQTSGTWKDSSIVCDANGWRHIHVGGARIDVGWWRRFNRVPGVDWFVLIACIGQTVNTARTIGTDGEIVVGRQDIANGVSTELFVFANDWPSRYRNNKVASAKEGGPMRLTITRVG